MNGNELKTAATKAIVAKTGESKMEGVERCGRTPNYRKMRVSTLACASRTLARSGVLAEGNQGTLSAQHVQDCLVRIEQQFPDTEKTETELVNKMRHARIGN